MLNPIAVDKHEFATSNCLAIITRSLPKVTFAAEQLQIATIELTPVKPHPFRPRQQMMSAATRSDAIKFKGGNSRAARALVAEEK